MTGTSMDVIGGVDSHADTHHAAVVEETGKLLDNSQFPASAEGYHQLAAWLRGHGCVSRVGVEGSGSYGAGLTRYLQACGIAVVEVNRPHAHTAARRGKTDAIDAEAAARKVLAGECVAAPKDTTGVMEAIRHLLIVRASAVKARTATLNQFSELLITAPACVRENLDTRGLRGKATQAAAWRPNLDRLGDPVQSAKYALRSLARRIHDLHTEAANLEAKLAELVHDAAPRTRSLFGIGARRVQQSHLRSALSILDFRASATPIFPGQRALLLSQHAPNRNPDGESGLRYQHPPGQQRTPSSLPQVLGYFVQKSFDPVLLDIGQGGSIDARCAIVTAHRDPRPAQDVPAIDLVPQRVKPSSRAGLGRPVQHMPQGTNRVLCGPHHGGTSLIGTHRAPPSQHCT